MVTIGNYRVLDEIGEGGFGRVYQAEHVILGEKACLKQNKDASADDAKLLLNEAKLLWKLDEYHSIPSVKDVLEIDKHNYAMVMSFIEGKTLEDVIAENGRLHPEDACWITERLLGALYYSHAYGVVHTDVKPPNVFVEPKKRDIKLIDFGLAVYKPKRNTTPVGYTPRYAAPEIQNGQTPIPETDLYGAGMCLLYACGGDVAAKDFPDDVPEPIVEFGSALLRFDPLQRPSWEKDNPVTRLSDIRHKVFGRRHRSES